MNHTVIRRVLGTACLIRPRPRQGTFSRPFRTSSALAQPLAQLTDDDRPATAAVPAVTDSPSSSSTSTTTSDNHLHLAPHASISDDLDEIRAALRDGRKDALDLALRYISTIQSTSSPPKSSPERRRHDFWVSAKRRGLGDLFDAFLAAGTPQSIADIRTIATRIDDARVIPHNVILAIVNLAMTQPEVYLPFLEQIVQLPPTNPTTPLLARIVPSLERIGVPKHRLANLIRQRLAIDPNEVLSWPGYQWQRLVTYCGLNTGFQILEQFKATVTPLTTESQDSLSKARIESIAKPFAGILRSWVYSKPRNRIGSKMPSRVAHDLAKLVGDENLPVLFLNQWLNAERFAGNYDTAWSIWERFYIPANLHEDIGRPVPNRNSWTIYLKLQRAEGRKCSRATWKALFNTTHPLDVSTTMLNAAVANVMTSGINGVCDDLPALLFLLSKFDWKTEGHAQPYGPRPDARTIDIVTAGLIRIWRQQGESLDVLFGALHAREVRNETRRWHEKIDEPLAIHTAEWLLVDQRMRGMRPWLPPRRERPNGARWRVPRILPMKGRSLPDGTITPPTKWVSPSRLFVPLMELVELAIKLHLAERYFTDAELNKAYTIMWKMVQDDILGSHEEALAYVVDGSSAESTKGEDINRVKAALRELFGPKTQDDGLPRSDRPFSVRNEGWNRRSRERVYLMLPWWIRITEAMGRGDLDDWEELDEELEELGRRTRQANQDTRERLYDDMRYRIEQHREAMEKDSEKTVKHEEDKTIL